MAGIAVSEGVVKTILVPGNGADVKKGNTITVHCTGILAANNKKFWRFDIAFSVYSYGVGIMP